MYNLRKRPKKGELSPEYSSEVTTGKSLRIILNRIPLLENPSNSNCTFEIKNKKPTVKKTQDAGCREMFILFLIFFGVFTSGILAIYYKGEYNKSYRTYIRKGLVLLPNELRSLTPYLNSVYVKWNEIFGEKRHGSMLNSSQKSYRVQKRSDMCYNDIRDFIREHWDLAEDGRIQGALSFIEEQCRLLKPVPKTADHAQFSFNNSDVTHDTDVNSLIDYASYEKGARILSTSGAEPYVQYKIQLGILQYILGVKYLNIDELPICRLSETLCRHIPAFATGPFSLLQPWNMPGECWSFKGTRGRVQIKLSERIFITAVSLEHLPPDFASTGDIRSAPAQFSLIGIDTEGYKFTTRNYLGTFRYLLYQPNIQTFILSKEDSSHPYRIIEFNVESNHGNENYTCVYRLRVHGRPINSLQNK